MDIRLLKNAEEIRRRFMDRFVLTWGNFQLKQKDWIFQMAEQNYPIDIQWYNQAFMWDRMDPDYSRGGFREALLALKEHDGDVLIMSEGDTHRYPGQLLYKHTPVTNFVAQVDVSELAALIETEWLAAFGLGEEAVINCPAILPEDLYVFDESMDWVVVFTHEATDLNAQRSDRMKAADSRYCIMYHRR